MPDDLGSRIQALGQGLRDAARVADDMSAMARRHGLDAAALYATDPLEALAAETCCAACDQVRRCHRHLDGHPDRPEEFCPNAARFAGIASGSGRAR